MRKKSKISDATPTRRALVGKKLVVVALPLLSEGEIPLVQGIRESLEQRGDYELMVLSGGYEATLRTLAESGQLAGAIGEFMSGRWLESLLSRRVRIVAIGSGAVLSDKTPSVLTDTATMGVEAARILLGGGVKAVGYLGPASPIGPAGSLHLGESFAEACHHQGVIVTPCASLSGALMKSFLQSLPHPAGLLCATDRLARMAILAGRESGLRIPQDLAVIGVGNSRMESLYAGVAISSFELPLEEIGRRAGSLMAGLLEGKDTLLKNSILIPPRLHERESSMRSSSGVMRALAYLRSHPESGITAGELARVVGMSRRSFENAVKENTGSSPGALLQTMRRERAERLLGESTLSIAAVGRACGYEEAAVFSTAFRRWRGKSPREFRRELTAA